MTIQQICNLTKNFAPLACVGLLTLQLSTSCTSTNSDYESELQTPESLGEYPDWSVITDIRSEGDTVSVIISVPDYFRGVDRGRMKNLIKTNTEETWRPAGALVLSPLVWNQNIRRAPSDKKYQYLYLEDVRMFLRSQDGGDTWTLPSFSIEGLPTHQFILSNGGSDAYTLEFHLAAIHPRNPETLYATVRMIPWGAMFGGSQLSSKDIGKLYVSNDGGESWNAIAQRIRFGSPLGISSSNPMLIFGFGTQGIIRTKDGGKSWQFIANNNEQIPLMLEKGFHTGFGSNLVIKQFSLDPFNESLLYIITNIGVYKSADEGKTWTRLKIVPLEYDTITSMGINPENSSELFVGTAYGVYNSEDQGASWKKIYPPKQ